MIRRDRRLRPRPPRAASLQVVTVNGLPFSYARQVLRIQRRRRLYGAKKRSSKTVHAVTDLPAEQASAAENATWARGHRTVEDTVHWERDVIFREDKCRSRPAIRPPCPLRSAT
ncbi:hypothetical protein ADL25_33680 [Streptomyces sp. NRRL F-5122]|nr:hypothetical protein ADL25_33680 [Streptomyces sp. NRRL F-5122]